MPRRFRPSLLLKASRRLLRNDQLVLAFMALFAGLTVGCAVVGFRELIGLLQWLTWGTASERLYDAAALLPWWQILLIPSLGGLAVGALAHWLLPGGRPQGVANVMEAAALHGGHMPLKPGLAAALTSALSIGVGASVGREGPAVHLGGSIASWIAARLRLGRNLSRSLLGCGVAAAVAASFNAPIAGALFAHEVVVGHYALSAFAPVVIASVTATMVSRGWFGNYPAFSIPAMHLGTWAEFPAFAGLGIACALTAVVFMHLVRLSESQMSRLPGPAFLRPAVGGFAVGVIALAFPQVLGVGYDITDDSLKALIGPGLLAALLLAKLAATAISLGSGLAGGVFGPALVLGAMLGGLFGFAIGDLSPTLASVPGIYALVGMGALASAVLGAPISTTLIVFELTGDYQVTVAVMLASVVANVLLSQITGRGSFFHWQLSRRGIDLEAGAESRILKNLKVADVVKRDAVTVPRQARLGHVRQLLQARPEGEVFVLCDGGILIGSITLADLAETAFDSDLDDLLNAQDVARLHPPVLSLEDDIGTAIDTMQRLHEAHMAVVSHDDTEIFAGWIHLSDALNAYNSALVTTRAEETGRKTSQPR
ncbi:chloride channel protein [Magnetospirillum sulfuroxidans]|uniref:Chloride channel protein n=1 Tax=Magnetospirillum sulfuroxidans TaxID=611300 RepID=A0ABS5IDD3_9PROT|nr:chloride channel protein [Magnetospirillum sulfuroxidans]MBR9971738.1 chloride channel protein [Magnetospirillum sulfuroxidans]